MYNACIMSYGVETLHTQRGTKIDLEEHKGPTGVGGIVAHWGDRIPDSNLKDRISEVFPGVELEANTGFDLIYHQPDGTTREQGIEDELEVAVVLLAVPEEHAATRNSIVMMARISTVVLVFIVFLINITICKIYVQ